MDKRSKHWADVLKWLETIANSCQTKEQAKSCERLVWNFHRVYQERLGLSECFDLTKEIDRILMKHLYPSLKSQKV